MGTIADQMPRGDDDVLKRLRALEQTMATVIGLAGNASALAQAIQTGLGNLATSGTTWAGPVASPSTVTAAGAITAAGLVQGSNIYTPGTVTADAGITSAGVNGNDLSSAGGGSKIVYSNNTSKQLGFLTSSRRFKQDITRATTTLDVLRTIHAYYFRYIAAVEQHPDDAYLWIGGMAEDLHTAGFTQLVEYGDDGEPFGLQMQLMWVVPHMYAELLDGQVTALTARVENLEADETA